MTNHRTDRTLNSIVGLAEGLTTKLPAARAQLTALINIIDGFPAGTDSPKVSATTELTTVEQAANQRIRLQNDRKALDDEINAAVQILSNLHKDCDRIIGTRIEVPRCSSTGREGAIEWADATCWDAPARGSLCAKCYQRERRWRERNGLPTRGAA